MSAQNTTRKPAPVAPDLSDTVLEGIALVIDDLLPGTEISPMATEVDAHRELLTKVLVTDPTLTPLVTLAGERAAAAGSSSLALLESWLGADVERLVFALQAAYYMSPTVRERLGYPGQGRYPVASATPDQLCSPELLAPVLERGPIFVPTPETSAGVN